MKPTDPFLNASGIINATACRSGISQSQGIKQGGFPGETVSLQRGVAGNFSFFKSLSVLSC